MIDTTFNIIHFLYTVNGIVTKFAIENVTKTRIVIADREIHILGSFLNIRIARDSLCSLIMGSSADKVYYKVRVVIAESRCFVFFYRMFKYQSLILFEIIGS